MNGRLRQRLAEFQEIRGPLGRGAARFFASQEERGLLTEAGEGASAMGDEVAPTRRAQETFVHLVRLPKEQQATLEWIAERPGSACPQLEEGEAWTPLGQWQVRCQDAAWRVWEGISSNVGPEAVFLHFLGHR